MRRPVEPRWIEDARTGCWDWQLYIAPNGYGRAWDGTAKRWKVAHRLEWERRRGPVPEGMDLDHLCRNRACVNPDHLDPVTRRENVRRGLVPKLNDAQASEITTRYGSGERAVVLAAEFGISRRYVTQLYRGERRVA